MFRLWQLEGIPNVVIKPVWDVWDCTYNVVCGMCGIFPMTCVVVVEYVILAKNASKWRVPGLPMYKSTREQKLLQSRLPQKCFGAIGKGGRDCILKHKCRYSRPKRFIPTTPKTRFAESEK